MDWPEFWEFIIGWSHLSRLNQNPPSIRPCDSSHVPKRKTVIRPQPIPSRIRPWSTTCAFITGNLELNTLRAMRSDMKVRKSLRIQASCLIIPIYQVIVTRSSSPIPRRWDLHRFPITPSLISVERLDSRQNSSPLGTDVWGRRRQRRQLPTTTSISGSPATTTTPRTDTSLLGWTPHSDLYYTHVNRIWIDEKKPEQVPEHNKHWYEDDSTKKKLGVS